MKIAVIGTRGVPATFGGVEKHCEEIYSILAELGHKITIYSRKGYIQDGIEEYKGLTIKTLPTFNSKYLEAPVHTILSLLFIVFSDADIIHFHAQGPCLFAFIAKVFAPKKKLIFTCHGVDCERSKWNFLSRKIIKLGEISSAKLFDEQITVSNYLENYYNEKYGINPITIPNGIYLKKEITQNDILKKFNLKPHSYLLFVGRLVPEKNIHKLIDCYKKLNTNLKLVIAGGACGTDAYERTLKNMSNPNIIFTSYIYKNDLDTIYSNAYAFISLSENEGLPLTLLEALSYKTPCIVSNIGPHVEIIERSEKYGYLIDITNLQNEISKLNEIISLPYEVIREKSEKAQKMLSLRFNWKNAAQKLNKIYHNLLK